MDKSRVHAFLLVTAICAVQGYNAFAIDPQIAWPRPGCPPRCPNGTTTDEAGTNDRLVGTTSARPARHRASRNAAGHHRDRGPLTGSTANQLNQEELARLRAGNLSNSPAPPAPGMAPPPSAGTSRGPSVVPYNQ
jgi:hypothetical protein